MSERRRPKESKKRAKFNRAHPRKKDGEFKRKVHHRHR